MSFTTEHLLINIQLSMGPNWFDHVPVVAGIARSRARFELPGPNQVVHPSGVSKLVPALVIHEVL
jgi:hypothetical protein